jgi:hypothetical protein
LCRFFLLAGITVFAQDTFDYYSQPGAYGLLFCPVDRHVSPDGPHQLLCNESKILITERFDGAVVGFKRVLEG